MLVVKRKKNQEVALTVINPGLRFGDPIRVEVLKIGKTTCTLGITAPGFQTEIVKGKTHGQEENNKEGE